MVFLLIALLLIVLSLVDSKHQAQYDKNRRGVRWLKNGR